MRWSLMFSSALALGCADPNLGSVVTPPAQPVDTGNGVVDVVLVDHETMSQLLPGESLRVDTTDPSVVTLFDDSFRAKDAERVELVCPDGTVMGLQPWLDKQQLEVGLPATVLDVAPLALSAEAMAARSVMDTQLDVIGHCACKNACEACADGLTLCTLDCPCAAPSGFSAPPPSDDPGTWEGKWSDGTWADETGWHPGDSPGSPPGYPPSPKPFSSYDSRAGQGSGSPTPSYGGSNGGSAGYPQ